ncbi:radical SAM family heme chaperone HemW [Bacillus benzoevorans]|uniref:Heme chaperone HemW n=1 Tax=Bacillus benzoevorans TaxID=1456 RepID=A0A7X0HSC1_9BACI|nr:radical SAM family heme chaperone HemW [Bacillus benzoevorans]MBB6445969.1 oxygen-independent coproporphyrinogen-3 oxidase [Bacillus benzoevorans]
MVKAAYIHIPFCEHICHYCDFNKVFLQGQPVEQYITALEAEIVLTLERLPAESLHSVFIGGGTPTALTVAQLDRLFAVIHKYLPLNKETEFTVEANPGDLSEDKLKLLYASGVNRLSFGVQSFNDELLKKIGRTHKAEDVFRSLASARKTGFDNISVDLIYSLPGQTLADFKATLQTAFSLETTHFSGYSLIVEPKTVFYQLLNKGKLELPGEDTEAAMYELLMEKMEQHHYEQYEISNFAKSGYESRHNLTYWDNNHYYGFGAGAHSYLNGVRMSNYGPLKKYMTPLQERKLPVYEEHTVTQREMMEEEMFLGLRKTKGVSIAIFQEKYGDNPLHYFKEQIEELSEKKWIQVTGGYISLTRQGRFLGNEVFQAFL